MRRKWQKIAIGCLLLVFLAGGLAYYERANIRTFFLVDQIHHSKHILSTAQIKLNLQPTLSTKNTKLKQPIT